MYNLKNFSLFSSLYSFILCHIFFVILSFAPYTHY